MRLDDLPGVSSATQTAGGLRSRTGSGECRSLFKFAIERKYKKALIKISF